MDALTSGGQSVTMQALPRFRSSELRDLARAARAQGWDVYQRKSGHVAAVNPRNGAQVSLSATASGTGAHSLGNARQAFIRAGLVLDRPSRHARQEAPMHVRDATPTEVQEVRNRPGGMRAGGKYRALAQESTEVGGHRVRITERADGRWIATLRDTSRKTGWRNYQDASRADLLAKVTTDLAAEPPTAEEAPQAAQEEERPTAQVTPRLVAWAAPEPDPAPESPDLAAYPLAAALDSLDRTLAPALAALEAAGKSDAAGLLRAEVNRTPVEEELLALYRRVAGMA